MGGDVKRSKCENSPIVRPFGVFFFDKLQIFISNCRHDEVLNVKCHENFGLMNIEL